MCLILFAYRCHPVYRLVLAANRDEFYARPTTPADFWEEAPEILAGRDLEAGGTWLGITSSGRFAALTNYRSPQRHQPKAPSRGNLVKDFLTGQTPPEQYLTHIHPRGRDYNGFNLLAGDTMALFYYANQEGIVREPKPGIYGLSNHLLNTPWPKVDQGRSQLSALMKNQTSIHTESLFAILADRSIPADRNLPDTGVGLEWERILSPLFITSSDYGTRSSSILLWERTGKVTFLERTFHAPAADGSQETIIRQFTV